jgi:hypothetical protein
MKNNAHGSQPSDRLMQKLVQVPNCEVLALEKRQKAAKLAKKKARAKTVK